MKRINFPKSEAPINSAMVEDCAIVGWSFVLYPTVPPANLTPPPETDQRVLGHAAQSKFTKPCRSYGPGVGHPSMIRSAMVLLIFGKSTTGRCSFGSKRQKCIPSSRVM